MDPTTLAVRLLIDGYLVMPDVIVGDELEGMRDAFERLADRLGKRTFTPDEISTTPELLNYIGYPGVMPVVEAFLGHFGHEPAITWLMLCRDIYDPAKGPPPAFDLADWTRLSIHSDASNAPKLRLRFDVLNMTLATFVFLDDTFADAGSIVEIPGSHHLTRRDAEGCVITPERDFMRRHCRPEYVAVRAGGVVMQRSFNFHGVGPPPRQKRRQLRADYMPKAFYHELSLDGRTGLHQRFSDETMALIPPDRHRYICAEDAQGAGLQPAAM